MKFLHLVREKSTRLFASAEPERAGECSTLPVFLSKQQSPLPSIKTLLHGTGVAMYIVGQERRLVDPPSQVVAGVRTVTTNMDGRDALPRMSRPFAFSHKEISPQHAPPGNLTQTRNSHKRNQHQQRHQAKARSANSAQGSAPCCDDLESAGF